MKQKYNLIIGLNIILLSLSPVTVYPQFFYPNFSSSNMAIQNLIQQQQNNTNEFINKQNRIDRSIEYKSYDGKTVECIVQISRNSGLTNVKAYVSNDQENKKINIDISDGVFVYIHVGGNDWTLNFGDMITVTCDQASVWKYKVGVDDNMTEPDWNRFIQNKIVAARNSKPNDTPSVTITNAIPIYIPQVNQNDSRNKQLRIEEINNEINQLDRKIYDAQRSLNLYREWDTKDPSITHSNLVVSGRQLLESYLNHKAILEQEKNRLLY